MSQDYFFLQKRQHNIKLLSLVFKFYAQYAFRLYVNNAWSYKRTHVDSQMYCRQCVIYRLCSFLCRFSCFCYYRRRRRCRYFSCFTCSHMCCMRQAHTHRTAKHSVSGECVPRWQDIRFLLVVMCMYMYMHTHRRRTAAHTHSQPAVFQIHLSAIHFPFTQSFARLLFGCLEWSNTYGC